MASEFDKKLRDRLEDASLDELMPEFDASAEWNRIEEKLPKKRKVVPVLWLSHAAAVVVGLLISWMLVKQWIGTDINVEPQPTMVYKYIDTTPHKTPEIAPVKEEVATVRKPVVRVRINSKPPIQEEPQTPLPVPINEQEQKEPEGQIAVEEPKQSVEEKETVVATRPKRNVQAVHLLDINNEDKGIMIEGGDLKLQYKDPIARLLSPSRLPENGSGNPDRPLLIRGFFEK